MITKPLITSMNDERMSTTNVLDFVDANLRAKILEVPKWQWEV